MHAYDTTEPITVSLEKGTRVLIRGKRALISLSAKDLDSIRGLLVPAEDRVAPEGRSRDREVTAFSGRYRRGVLRRGKSGTTNVLTGNTPVSPRG